MGLIITHTDSKTVKSITFEDLDSDKDMEMCVDFINQNNESETISFYFNSEDLKTLKRHLDFELSDIKSTNY